MLTAFFTLSFDDFSDSPNTSSTIRIKDFKRVSNKNARAIPFSSFFRNSKKPRLICINYFILETTKFLIGSPPPLGFRPRNSSYQNYCFLFLPVWKGNLRSQNTRWALLKCEIRGFGLFQVTCLWVLSSYLTAVRLGLLMAALPSYLFEIHCSFLPQTKLP